MLCNISKLVVVVIVGLAVGCQTKNPSQSSSSNEELRLLTPEQKKKLYENAERVERKEVIKQSIVNDKGEIIGTTSSQTTVIFLKPGLGGGRFGVNTSCTGSCTGTPLNLCPSGPSFCGCNIVGDNCVCGTGCAADSNCQGTCSSNSIGFGNFGIFIAMDRDNRSPASVVRAKQVSVTDVACRHAPPNNTLDRGAESVRASSRPPVSVNRGTAD